MKKHILALTIASISLFLGTQVISMDRNPSAEGIRNFKIFLASKLQAEQSSYLGNEQFPMFEGDALVQWKKHILDMARKDRINRAVAQDIFLSMLRETIMQEVASRNPDYDMAIVENLYSRAYLPDVKHATYLIFR